MNLRTTIGPKLLCSLILCLWIFSTAQRAEAGPILAGSAFSETPEALHVLVLHGAVAGPVAQHFLLPSPPGAVSWDFSIAIAEVDGGANVADFVQVIFGAQHIVGVPGHVGEGRNPARGQFNILTTNLALVPGDNVRPLAMVVMDHGPIANHNDLFSGTVTFTVAMDGLSITAFRLEFFVTHCSPQCPAVPAITGQLQDVPEWNALMLFGSGLLGLLGYGWRRKNVWLRQRKRS